MSKTGIDQRWAQARDELQKASRTAGVDVATLVKIAGFESGYNPAARPISSNHNANRVRQFDGTMAVSSAHGYGQFVDGTWHDMIRKYGEKYGVVDAQNLTRSDANTRELRTDLSLQAAMLAEFTRENALKGNRLGGPNPDANVYAFHNLGDGDATKFLQALRTNPNQSVDSILSANVIKGNPALYGNGGRSVAEAYDVMGRQMARFERFAQQARVVSGEDPHVTAQQLDTAIVHTTQDMHERIAHDPKHRSTQDKDDTRHLQHLLNKLGYRDAFGHSLRVDGDFGDRSREAVHAFQQAHGLPQVDHVGPRTREALRSAERSPSPVDPSHPDHALYRQALAGVHRLDHEHGRAPDAGSDRLAASLTRLAKENGLIRVDHVVLSIDNGTVKRGENVFVVQGAMGDPAHRLAYMKTQVAIDAPVVESFRQLEQGNALQRQQAMQVEPLQASPRVHAQQPAAYAEGPRMVPAR